jgi:hypothetical protein
VGYLALEIAEFDNVVVDHREFSDARGRKEISDRAAQPARPDYKNPGCVDLGLTLAAHFGQYNVAAVALYLLVG